MFAYFKNTDRSYVRRVNPTVWVLWHWVMIGDKYQPVFVIDSHRILACSIASQRMTKVRRCIQRKYTQIFCRRQGIEPSL